MSTVIIAVAVILFVIIVAGVIVLPVRDIDPDPYDIERDRTT